MIYMVIVLLILLITFIIIKTYNIKKSIKEIQLSFNRIIQSDTNNLITVSSRDKDIVNLANDLNIQLKTLRKEKLQYINGNNELKKIVTNISHDMRTPLTAISGYIDLINESGKNNNYINVIDRKKDELIKLTEQLFDFSKYMEFGINIKKQKCCINDILEESLASYYTFFKSNNITPDIHICNDKIYKNTDKNILNRIFDNILTNILKYCEGEFKVILSSSGKIIFSNKAQKLDQITVQKIFDRYFTVENAKKSTGIGLSIAKQLVNLIDGKINALYKDGKLIIEIILN